MFTNIRGAKTWCRFVVSNLQPRNNERHKQFTKESQISPGSLLFISKEPPLPAVPSLVRSPAQYRVQPQPIGRLRLKQLHLYDQYRRNALHPAASSKTAIATTITYVASLVKCFFYETIIYFRTRSWGGEFAAAQPVRIDSFMPHS